jgi:regulator of sigma E protease
MDLIITVVAFLFLIGVVITIHEGGHYLMAQVGNIKVLEFSIGFGKKIFSKKLGKDQTLFTLRLLPLGGYVKPLEKSGLTDEEWLAVSEQDKKRTLSDASRGKKALMVAGGPGFNFILAFVIYIFASSVIGIAPTPAKIAQIMPNSLFAQAGVTEGETIKQVNGKNVKNMNDAFGGLANGAIKGESTTIVTDKKSYNIDFSKLDLNKMDDNISRLMGLYFVSSEGDIITKKVNSGSPAEKYGLLEDDMIKKINGIEVRDLGKFIRILANNPEKMIEVEVLRKDKTVLLKILPEAKAQGSVVMGKIGASFKTINTKEEPVQTLSVKESLVYSYDKVVDSAHTTLVSLGKLVTGQMSVKTISGPLAIADYSGKSAQIGLYAYLSVMAAISIAVGVFNLLPIPMLDGGLLVQYGIEAIRQKDLTEAILKRLQFVGVAILGSMFFIAMFNDILKYVVL